MFNNISMEGRLTCDPSLKKTVDGLEICNISIACDKPKSQGSEALFIGVTFFGNQAIRVSQYFRKGRAIIVTGRLDSKKYEAQGCVLKVEYYIVASSFDFPTTEPKSATKERQKRATKPTFDTYQDDADIWGNASREPLEEEGQERGQEQAQGLPQEPRFWEREQYGAQAPDDWGALEDDSDLYG